jgi:hypothetical protein
MGLALVVAGVIVLIVVSAERRQYSAPASRSANQRRNKARCNRFRAAANTRLVA